MSEEILRHRIHNRNLIIGIRGEVVLCIVELDFAIIRTQKCAEVSASHCCGKNARACSSSAVTTNTFIVDEEEELIAKDGPTEGATEEALRIGVLGDGIRRDLFSEWINDSWLML